MNRVILILAGAALLGIAASSFAHPGPRRGYRHSADWRQVGCLQQIPVHNHYGLRSQNENRDGSCELNGVKRRPGIPRPDLDGDGIPNGQDADFQRGFVDLNHDGVCDHHSRAPEVQSEPDKP